MLKALFLDLDGTLADSLPLMFHIYSHFLSFYQIKGSQQEFQELNGPTLKEVVQILKDRYQITEDFEKLWKRYIQVVEETYASQVKPFPGVVDFLEHNNRLGLKNILVTSAHLQYFLPFLEAQDLKKYFTHIISGDLVIKSKPDPSIYKLALKESGFQANEGIALEDSANGILAAQGAGIKTILISHNEHSLAKNILNILGSAKNFEDVKNIVAKEMVFA